MLIHLSRVSVGSQTSPRDWVDLLSWNSKFFPGFKSQWVDLVSLCGIDLFAKKDQVDLVSQNLPSKLTPSLTENLLCWHI